MRNPPAHTNVHTPMTKKKRTPLARSIYLIERGPKESQNNVQIHPVIVCSRLYTAKWEARNTETGATVWEQFSPFDGIGNWFCCKYKGYEFDNILNVNFVLFDGIPMKEVNERAKKLLQGAVWWSYDRMPKWVAEAGVVYPPDDWSKDVIWRDYGIPDSYQGRKIEDKKYEYIRPEWLHTHV